MSTFAYETQLFALDGAANDWLGYRAVDIDGHLAVASALHHATGGMQDAGAAYIFERTSSGWVQVAQLTAGEDADALDEFGCYVAIDGETIVVGARQDEAAEGTATEVVNAGAAYIFERNQGGPDAWGQVAKLEAADATTGDGFGAAVDIGGDFVVVGAYQNGALGYASGAAYVFGRDFGGPDHWGQVTKLTASDAAAYDSLGTAVAIDGQTIVVGAEGDDYYTYNDRTGSAYIFEPNGFGAWTEVAKLWPSDPTGSQSRFGMAVDVHGDTVVVGAGVHDRGGFDSGSAYLFQRDWGGPDKWGQVKQLRYGGYRDLVGARVAVEGDTAIVGAFGYPNYQQRGTVFVYERNEGGADNWGQSQQISATDGVNGDQFSYAVALDQGTLLVSSLRQDTPTVNDVGSIYVYSGNLPTADAGGPYSGFEGAAVVLDASASYDPNLDPLQYRWDFENDGSWDTGWSDVATVEHVWTDQFSGSLALEVSDGFHSDVATASVTIENVSPQFVSLEVTPDVANENDEVTLAGIFVDGTPVTSDLVAWWRAEGNADDSRNGFDATLHGDTTFVAGVAGQAFAMDGSGDYVLAPYAIGAAENPETTISVWVNPTSLPVSDALVKIGDKRSLFVSNRVMFGGTTSSLATPNQAVYAVGPDSVAVGAWTHLLGTWDGDTARLYINGELVAENDSRNGNEGSEHGNVTSIGSGIPGYGDFDGLVDDVRIYERALAPDEIKTLYHQTAHPTEDPFELLVDWGDGESETFHFPAGTTSFQEPHVYLDDPDGVPDEYTIMVTLADGDASGEPTWSPLTPTGSLPSNIASQGISGHNAVYDDVNNRMIVYGGLLGLNLSGPGTELGNVLVLENADGTTGVPQWREVVVAGTNPAFRAAHDYIYDADSNRLTVFGGNVNVGYCGATVNDTWTLENADGTTGTPQWHYRGSGPPARRHTYTLNYDPATDRMILFGGNVACPPPLYNDVWVLENATDLGAATWTQLTPSGPPPTGRGGHTAVYDQANNRLILFGGAMQTGLLEDVWVLEHANGLGGTPVWSQLSPLPDPVHGTPGASRTHVGVYDPDTNRMILFGDGESGVRGDVSDDTWVLENANGLAGAPQWRWLDPRGTAPAPRQGHSAVYDADSDRMLIFGGQLTSETRVTSELWVLDLGSESTLESVSVTVNNVAPDFEAGPDEALPTSAAGQFGRTVSFTDPGTQDLHTVRVDWDGDTIFDQDFTLPVGDRSFELEHEYADGGVYTVTVQVEDDDDGWHTDSFDVTVFFVQIIDNDDPGYSDTGDLGLWTNQGFQGDVREALSGGPTEVATYTFDAIAGAVYDVWATWTPFMNRSSAAPYTLLGVEEGATTITVNQLQAPNDLTTDGAGWEHLGAFMVDAGGQLIVELRGTYPGNVIADAVRVSAIVGSEIRVFQESTELASGSSVFDFGTVLTGQTLARQFTITNIGPQPLELQPVDVPAGFVLVGDNFRAGQLVDYGQSVHIWLAPESGAAGAKSGTLSIPTNDSDENPFTIQLAAQVEQYGRILIDNDEPGYADSGDLGYWTGQGFHNDVREAVTGGPVEVATFTFAGLPAGDEFELSTTWTPYLNRTDEAPYTIRGVTVGETTVTVNQRLAPDDFEDLGYWWESLGTFTVDSGGVIVVQLNGRSDGNVIADAVRLDRWAPALLTSLAPLSVSGLEAADVYFTELASDNFGSAFEASLRNTLAQPTADDLLASNEPLDPGPTPAQPVWVESSEWSSEQDADLVFEELGTSDSLLDATDPTGSLLSDLEAAVA